MKRYKRKIFYALLIAVACFIYFDGPERLVNWYSHRGVSPYLQYSSLRPELIRSLSVRFDPSYYYEQQKHPITLAAELAEKWREHGVSRVFFRAYDPRYGAFYKTEYSYNRTGDYGKSDLLGKVIKACHSRGIKVFSWFPVLNHAGAWEKQPHWRIKASEGGDYSVQGLEFPLDPENESVRRWWQGFLSDFLDHYPDIDGIDFGEPVVSWGGTQKVSDMQVEALTSLLGESTALVHQKQKKVCITTVQTAMPSGKLLPPADFRKMTGFDLTGIFKTDKYHVPDMICPEFIWQEMKSRYETDQESSVFKPAWTEKAVHAFMQWIKCPVEVVTHVELTDFPGVPVDGDLLKSTFQAAVRGGAAGLDVYSAHELDVKEAWPVISDARHMTLTKNCLVLYDREGGENDGVQTGELLRHFNTEVTLKSLDQYSPGDMNHYHAVFYVGTSFHADLPDRFLSDLRKREQTFCWLGYSIDELLMHAEISKALGIRYIKPAESRFDKVIYKGQTLVNENPWLNIVQVTDPVKSRILAKAWDGEIQVPYAVRCGRNFWYVADVPSSHAVEGGRFLVFADLLHDILNEDHAARQTAMVRIEDVHPLTDPNALKKIASFLHAQDVPFQISLVPFYVFPERNIYVGLNEKPALVEAVKYMVRKGGVVVMHGATHQRFGETTSDYEFWDPVNDQPPEGTNAVTIRAKIEKGLSACWTAGIYPLMWETPHYAGSQELYSVVKDYFSIAMERRQAMDSLGTDQYLPYILPQDRYGQTMVPENLGYVPVDRQDPEVILTPARHMKVVRDGVASFFFHPFININVLKTIVKRMKKEGFEFTTIGDLPIRVQTPFGMLTNLSGEVALSTGGFSGREYRGVFPGIMKETGKVEAETGDVFTRNVTLKKGELYFVRFMPQDIEVLSDKEIQDAGKIRGLQPVVPDFYGEQRNVPRPLLIEPFTMYTGGDQEFQSLKELFRLVGIPLTIVNVSKLADIPESGNIVIIPSAAAKEMTDDAVETVLSALRKGRISLFTSGESKLSDEIGIEQGDTGFVVQSVRDTYYPDLKIQWDPPVNVREFNAPAASTFIYEDRDTGNPLLVSARLNRGRYMYLGVPCTDASVSCYRRFPYLLTHFFRSMNVFPLVRRAAAEVYFNPAEREDIPVETLVKEWRRMGIRVLYTAAWQVFPEWTYDYGRLIRLAHTNGILVYAWFEFPHVNDRLWLAHPEWREKNILGKDVEVGWHKPMALSDNACFDAVKSEMADLLERFDWDGILINRVGWEAENGMEQPETYTPFHPAAQDRFKQDYGFNPMTLALPSSPYYWKTNARALRRFEQWRSREARGHLDQLLTVLYDMKSRGRDDREIILTYDESRKWNGLSFLDMTDFKQRFNVTLQLAPVPGRQWTDLPDSPDMIRIFVGPDEKGRAFYPGAPTAYPSGTTFYELLGGLIRNHKRFSILSENALYDVDRQMLPLLLAGNTNWTWTDNELSIQTPVSAEIVFFHKAPFPILLDNAPAGSVLDNAVIVPAGDHTLSAGKRLKEFLSVTRSATRLMDCSADVLSTRIVSLGLEVTYRADRRTVMIVNEEPLNIMIDGIRTPVQPEKGLSGWAVMLPGGEHTVTVYTRTLPELFLAMFSLVLSNTIIIISLIAIITFVLISMTLIVGRRRKKKRRT